MPTNEITMILLGRLREARLLANLSATELDQRLLLGPGWTERFEIGEVIPSIDMILAIAHELELRPAQLFRELEVSEPLSVTRDLYAEAEGNDLVIHFRYAEHDAQYRLREATIEDFQNVLKTLQHGLARLVTPNTEAESGAILTDSVTRAFLHAVRVWPHANPSDLWWFFIYRAYLDPFNHPAFYARRDFGQSWRRTGGWALEEIVVRHYAPFLQGRGITITIAHGTRKARLVGQLRVSGRLEADKVDVFLVGQLDGEERCFGVVHVKTSFAERRTDDVPLSQALMAVGYTSILWTLDAKSSPSPYPVNRGELGALLTSEQDRRSAKRKDIEEDGYFSACFSYNTNTRPTAETQTAAARIYVCNFANPDDAFSRFVVLEWDRFRNRQ